MIANSDANCQIAIRVLVLPPNSDNHYHGDMEMSTLILLMLVVAAEALVYVAEWFAGWIDAQFG